MITGYIKGQNLTIRTPMIAADTIDYLTAQFVFQTVDWEGCRLFSHWKCGETNYTIELSDAGKIEKEQHLNLTAGTWTVWIHGERYRDRELIQRITTDEATLTVTATGTAGGSPFPEVPASDLERINAEIAELQDKVGSGGGAASGDAMRLLARVEVPYEGTPPIIDMIDFSRKYTFLDIAEAYVAGRTITLNTEHDLVPYQYGMFWLDHLSSHVIEFHGHYRRVKDVEADVEEGWVPAVAFLREDGTLTIEDREWSGYAKQAEVDSLSKAIADKADKPTYSDGNLQIGDEEITSDVYWDYSEGLPQESGFAFTGTDGTAVLRDDGVMLSPGAEYKLPVLTASAAVMECVFVIPSFATYQYGFVLQLTNGAKGIRISCYVNQLRYNQNTSNNVTVANLATDTEYTLHIEWDENTGANVYLNGEQVITGGMTVYALAENVIKQTHSGTTLLKSVSLLTDSLGGVEISSINGANLADATARNAADNALKAANNKADKAGWTPNKYIGTDAGGNLVARDAPEGGGGSGGGSGNAEYETINTVTIDEPVSSITIDKDSNGNSFELINFAVLSPLNVTASKQSQFIVVVNDKYNFSSSNGAINTSNNSLWIEFERFGAYLRELFLSSTYSIEGVMSQIKGIRLANINSEPITSLIFKAQDSITLNTGTFILLGVRK